MSSSKKQKIEFDESLSLPETVDHLAAILDGLRSGVVILRRGDRSVRLVPCGNIQTRVKAKTETKDGHQSLSVELSWDLAPENQIVIGDAQRLQPAPGRLLKNDSTPPQGRTPRRPVTAPTEGP